ncbi:unnamed protein product [Arctogadus glacialis]
MQRQAQNAVGYLSGAAAKHDTEHCEEASPSWHPLVKKKEGIDQSGFVDLANLSRAIERHGKSKSHIDCAVKLALFGRVRTTYVYSACVPVTGRGTVLNEQTSTAFSTMAVLVTTTSGLTSSLTSAALSLMIALVASLSS